MDDVVGAWLLCRLGGFAGAQFEFVSVKKTVLNPDADPSLVYIGVGLSRFDEHTGKVGETATTLVWDSIKNSLALSEIKRHALERLVDWTKKEDLGMLKDAPLRDFSVSAIFAGASSLFKSLSPQEYIHSTFFILDCLLTYYENEVMLEIDWQNRIEFLTKWGKGVALVTKAKGFDAYAYTKGFILSLAIDAADGHRSIKARADSNVDLSEVYRKLLALEPGRDWFLHHSKRMLLCAGANEQREKKHYLNPKELIELLINE